jgi:biopolymer transport protein ExbD
MAMSVGPGTDDEDVPMSDINVVPFTDVMLVLLIIFLIAVPVVIQTCPSSCRRCATSDDDQAGQRLADGAQRPGRDVRGLLGHDQGHQKELLDRAVKKLEDQIKKVGGVQNITEENMPEAHIRGDINTQYKCIGAAIITMQQAGFQRVGFISEPPPLAGVRVE